MLPTHSFTTLKVSARVFTPVLAVFAKPTRELVTRFVQETFPTLDPVICKQLGIDPVAAARARGGGGTVLFPL
jgi:hypothetical protein